MSSPPETFDRRNTAVVTACFLGAAAAAVGLTFVYWYDDNIALEGICVGVCFSLLAVGLVQWSRVLPQGPYVDDYPKLRSRASAEAEALASLDRGGIGRRRLLIASLGLAGASVGAGVVSSVRSLGPGPYSLGHTAWRGGRTLVTEEGVDVRTAGMPVDSILTVFPKGFIDSPEVPAILIRLPLGLNRPLPGRATWAPDGFICYSKICSHAGCPVNLYNHYTFELQCPCHQSTFNVLDGAEPVFGPAGTPLVQLPLAIESDGVLRSTGDFSGPPGPTYWHHS